MKEDIGAIRDTVTKIVDKGQHVVLVLHAEGGTLGSAAIEGLSVETQQLKNLEEELRLETRHAKRLEGGVSKIVFVAGAIYQEGYNYSPQTAPCSMYDDAEPGALRCRRPEKVLFNDLEEEKAKAWAEKLQPQPAYGWQGMVNYCGWREISSVYLVCEGDECTPPTLQTSRAEIACSQVERCAAGHMPMISMPEKVVQVIVKAAQA